MDPPLQFARKKEQFCNELIVQCVVLISSLFYTSYDVEIYCIVMMFSYVNMKRHTSAAVFSPTICHSKNTSASSLSKKLLANYGTTRSRGKVFNHNHNHFNHCGTPTPRKRQLTVYDTTRSSVSNKNENNFHFHFIFLLFIFKITLVFIFIFIFNFVFIFMFLSNFVSCFTFRYVFIFAFFCSVFYLVFLCFFFYFSMILMDHHTKL